MPEFWSFESAPIVVEGARAVDYDSNGCSNAVGIHKITVQRQRFCSHRPRQNVIGKKQKARPGIRGEKCVDVLKSRRRYLRSRNEHAVPVCSSDRAAGRAATNAVFLNVD